jgi:general secretion pathway protein N
LLEAPVNNDTEQFTIGPIGQYQETVQRPLFSSTRRPPPPPEPEAPELDVPVPPEPKDERDYILLGVMLTPEATMALLKDDHGNISRLRLGDKIDDWRLEQVNPENVVLRQGGRVKDLPLLRNQQPQLAAPQQQAPARMAPQPSGQEDPRELRRRLLQQHRALRQQMERDARNQNQAVPQASATN